MAFEGHETRRRGLAGIGSKDFRRIRSSNGTEEQSIGCETLLAPAFVKHACAIDCPQRGERGLCSGLGSVSTAAFRGSRPGGDESGLDQDARSGLSGLSMTTSPPVRSPVKAFAA
jgi:hypothetical protein